MRFKLVYPFQRIVIVNSDMHIILARVVHTILLFGVMERSHCPTMKPTPIKLWGGVHTVQTQTETQIAIEPILPVSVSVSASASVNTP